MMRMIIAAAILTAAMPMAFAQDHAGGAVKATTADKGAVLTDAKGMTLYTFDKDEAGKSNCYDQCATNWPPLAAAADAKADGDFTIVDRTDGTKQWAYMNKPLYLWAKDTKPGDTTGDGVGQVWHTATQ